MKGSLPAFGLVAAFGFFLEYLGTHGGCYIYGGMYLAKLSMVPLIIIAMWGVLGWAAWQMYKRRGLLAGLLTPLALDICILEPLAYHTGLWAWTRTISPRVWFSTIGNYIVYLLVAILAITVFSRLNRSTEGR